MNKSRQLFELVCTFRPLSSPCLRTFRQNIWFQFTRVLRPSKDHLSTFHSLGRYHSRMSLPNVVFVLGPPGAGKGTQCQKIVQEFDYVHLSAGDLLRNERNFGGPVAEEIEKHITGGTIVPVEITVGLLNKAIQKSFKEDNKTDFLIDGFPRNQDNLDGWIKVMDGKANVKFVLFFDVSDETGVERALKRGEAGSGRSDDNEVTLRKRIATYKSGTMPIIDHYRKLDLVRIVDGTPPPDQVFAEVRKHFA